MGAYSPSSLNNLELEKKIIDQIVKPTFQAVKDFGANYVGFLYVGLMIKNNKPYLVEFNVRMGDPECQTILPLLDFDLLELLLSCCDGNLDKQNIKWYNKKSLCIVLCSKGYPDDYKKNIEIKDLKKLKNDENNFVFHAGTKVYDNKVLANGGRVLNFVSISEDFKNSRNLAIKKIEKLNWSNGFYRKDIGYKVIN